MKIVSGSIRLTCTGQAGDVLPGAMGRPDPGPHHPVPGFFHGRSVRQMDRLMRMITENATMIMRVADRKAGTVSGLIVDPPSSIENIVTVIARLNVMPIRRMDSTIDDASP
jgi:hypothetical protein